MIRALALASLVAVLVVLAACAGRGSPDIGTVVVNRGDEPVYSYVRVGEVYHVVAPGETGFATALERIGCEDSPCALDRVGVLWTVEVFP